MTELAVVLRLVAGGSSGRYRVQLEHALKAAGTGTGVVPDIDLGIRHRQDTLTVLSKLAFEQRHHAMERLRIATGLLAAGSGAALLDALGDPDPDMRRAAAEACGLLGLEAAVPSIGVLLSDRARQVRLAATWALGRIGGYRAADFLMRALRSRRLPLYRVVISLAKAAPDFYLEAAVADAHERDIRPRLVVAIGLRRRQAARPLLLSLLDAEDAHSRAAACRALSWLADSRDATVLLGMLADADVSVREAAWVALRPYSRRYPVAAGGPVSPSISVVWPDPEPWRPVVAGFEVSG